MNNYIKTLYTQCSNYLDTNFTESTFDKLPTSQQHDRLAELRFTKKFIDVNIIDRHVSYEGLDIKLKPIGRPCRKTTDGWAEYVCAHQECNNGIPVPFNDADEDELLLRITSVIHSKNKKIISDISKGIVKYNEPIILCVNIDQICNVGSRYDIFLMNKLEGNLPSVVRTVYPISKLTAKINVTHPEKSSLGRDYNRFLVKAKTGTEISQAVFLDKEYAQISAVLFNSNQLGYHFILIHNCFAKNPIRRKLLSNCLEYIPSLTPCIGGKCLHIKEVYTDE